MSKGRQVCQTEGLVLHVRNHRDSDRVVEALTPDHGRISLLARGARASKRRFAGTLDLFVSLRLHYVPSGNLWTLQAADLLSPRLGIRQSLPRFNRATTFVDCIRVLTAEHQGDTRIYEVCAEALDAVDAGEISAATEAYVALVDAAGIMPPLPPAPHISREQSTAVHQVLSGGPCTDEATATSVESWAVEQVEKHAGRRLRSRSVCS